MILVTGATGQVGKAVLDELISQQAGSLRVIYRDEKDKHSFPPNVQAIQADFSDAPSLDRALTGVTSAYLVCAAVPNLVQLETQFLEAAHRVGTGYLVIQSALGAGDFKKSFPACHRQVEDCFIQSSKPCSFRPSATHPQCRQHQDDSSRTIQDGRFLLFINRA
jgi:uncharacterized protein YbjT (DUF2867 family)